MKRPWLHSIVLALLIAALALSVTATWANQNDPAFLGVKYVVGARGTEVVEVLSGSPADAAGFHSGDVILTVNGVDLSATTPLESVLIKLSPGAQVQFTVTRGERALQLTATLGRMMAATSASTSAATDSALSTPAATPSVAATSIPSTLQATLPSPVTVPPPVTPLAATVSANSGTAFLGVRVVNAPDGARVTGVLAGSPADLGGVQVGDLLIALDDQRIQNAVQVQEIVGRKSPGDLLLVRLQRGDTQLDVTIRLVARTAADEAALTPTVVSPSNAVEPAAGAVFSQLGFRALIEPMGLRVAEIRPGSPATQVGLRSGDLIVRVDRTDYNFQNVTDVIQSLAANPRAQIVLTRDGQTITVSLSGPVPTVSPVRPIAPSTTVPIVPVLPVQRTRLGVTYEIVTASIAAERKLSVQNGALVTEVVPNSPADAAGIKIGDVIAAVEGDKVDAKRTLVFRMLPYNVGDTVTLTVVRGSETLQIAITLTVTGRASVSEG